MAPFLIQQQLILIVLLVILRLRRRKVKRKHKMWVRRIFQQRLQYGHYHTLVPELRLHDREYFYRYLRMSPERLEHLLSLVGPYITKQQCRSRHPISPGERLVVTLRYLASGDSQQSQSFNFRMGRTTVSNIIRSTCEGIWKALSHKYLKAPQSAEDWLNIAENFEVEWDFPNCLGALDGKHICIECPHNGGSAFYNYKSFHSLTLLAVCDSKYTFTMVDFGGYGRENDASLLQYSEFGQAFESAEFQLPTYRQVHGFQLPYVIVGDGIFPLKPWLMKPYGGQGLLQVQRIYNYRLSRARRTIENSFGIYAARWRIFRRPIKASVSTTESIIKATLCLHNYLALTENAVYIPQGFVDCENDTGEIVPGDWRGTVESNDSGITHLNRVGSNHYSFEAAKTRDNFVSYFNSSAGSLSWQTSHVMSCGKINS